MKKVFLILALILSFTFGQSCSDSNDNEIPNNPSNENVSINPPEWIQGVWGVRGTEILEFTNDDFLITGASLKQSHKKLIEMGQKGGQKVEVKETVSDSSYQLIMTFNGTSVIHKFEKITNSKIKWINTTTVTLVRL